MVGLNEVLRAARQISPFVRRTPLLRSHWLSEWAGRPVYLKPEFWQETGSFKVRGAANFLLTLVESAGGRRVITASAGNHGMAVAYMAAQLGIEATIVVPATSPQTKREGIVRLGASLCTVDGGYDLAHETARAVAQTEGMTYVPAYEDEAIIAGQGTIGLEIVSDLPNVAEVYVPVGGGGLAAGVGLAITAAAPGARVIGVQSELTPAMCRSLAAGTPVPVDEPPTLCDGLAGGVDAVTLTYAQHFLSSVELVSEEHVAEAIRTLLRHERWVVEGSGAVGVAWMISRPTVAENHGPTVIVLTGRNIDAARLCKLIE